MRRAFLDAGPGERRAVVTLDGRPERLLIERMGEERGPLLGARRRVRVRELSADRRLAHLDLGRGGEGVASLGRGAAIPTLGAAFEAEVTAEARRGKAAVLRLAGPAEGEPAELSPAPKLEERLQAFAPGAALETGSVAREVADLAEEEALAAVHSLGGGLALSIEPTRALVAVDVDFSGPGRRAVELNRRAIREAARLLRLKGLGGTLVIDLLGFPGPDDAIRAAAREAFAPDGPGVSVLPVSRLGLLQVAKPHREQPVIERLADADGRLAPVAIAQRLARSLEREGRGDPGARLQAACATEVAEVLAPIVARLGPRFSLAAELGWAREKTDIRPA